ncbi:MAG: sensor histidine kinase [Bacteroidetes bacterium]|nr:sensor histidine kinase [Bacteroidota bacterium]
MRAALLLFFILVWLGIKAQETQRCRITNYNSNEGLSGSVIKDITSDKNRFIWMISDNHLQYFDGQTFHILHTGRGIHEVPGKIFQSLYSSPNGEVWVFYQGGISVYNPSTHSFRHSPPNSAFARQTITHVSNPEGDLVINAGEDYFKINLLTKQISKLPIQRKGLPLENSNPRSAGNFEFQDQTLHYFSAVDSTIQPVIVPLQKSLVFPIEADTNTLLIFRPESVSVFDLRQKKEKVRIPYPFSLHEKVYKLPQDAIQDGEGKFWVILDNQVWQLDLNRKAFTKALVNLKGEGFIKKGYCKKMYLDSQKNLWVSTNLNGLFRVNLEPQNFTLFSTPGEDNNFVKCFLVDKKANRVLCGTYGSGIKIYDSTGTFLNEIKLKKSDIVTSMVQAGDWQCIVLLYGYNSPFLLNYKNNTFKKLPFINLSKWDFNSGYYAELIPVGNNNFYYETNLGPLKFSFQNNTLHIDTFVTGTKLPLPPERPLSCKGQDLAPFFGEHFIRSCLGKAGLSEIGANIILPLNDAVVLGTAKGVFVFNKQTKLLRFYGMREGLPDEVIYGLLGDGEGNIWCSHNLGLSRISPQGEIQNYSREDGLQDNEFNFCAALSTPEGQLYFAGINGLNSFYPRHLNQNSHKLALRVTHIRVNETNLYDDTAYWNIKKLDLPVSRNRIQLTLSAIGNLPSGAYQYQYRITGLESSWHKLYHTNELKLALSPGAYIIEIAAFEKSNPATISYQTLSININNPFYLRGWFMAGLLAASGILVWLLTKWFNHRKYQRRLQMQQALDEERLRISRDLHDNIGAYTTALLANTDRLEGENNIGETTGRIRKNAQQILTSLRNTIWILNTQKVTVESLHENIKNYCFKLLQNFEGISFKVEEEIVINANLTSGDALHLNNLIQEAVQNVVKHSRAKNMTYRMQCRDSLVVEIEDDGAGFDTETVQSGYGLKNMRWRAQQAGAEFTIQSSPGSGTRLTIQKKCS